MKSIVARAIGAATLAGTTLGIAVAPASASIDNTFSLTAGAISAYGTYDLMMSIPEQPVPPFLIKGTLAVNSATCGVAQINYNGPTDAIQWRTVRSLCGKGKTNFQASSGFLRGENSPKVRLCTGATVSAAERGTTCRTYTPPADV